MPKFTEEFKYIRPSIGRVCVVPLTTEEVTKGGLYLPFGGETLAICGEVVAVSEPYRAEQTGIEGPVFKVGDVVIYGKYVGADVELGRTKVLVMRESDIIGTLHK